MLRIRRSTNGEVVLALSGELDKEQMVELEVLIRSETAQHVVLDLRDLTLVGRDAISFLHRCETTGVTLRNCAGYVREWIAREGHSC